jgi:hypothetical protein
MIGFNGGLIGGLANARDTSALASQPGVWTLPEQRNAKLALLWPVVGGVIASVTGSVTTQDLGGYRIHTFTGNGNFIVTQEGAIDYLIVGGGGGGGNINGGGGGAGGFREGTVLATIADHSVVVGAAGVVNNGETPKPTGGASSVLGISAAGGGCGANSNAVGSAGGSGGGGSRDGANPGLAGNTPPTSPAQGFAGGTSSVVGGNSWRGGSGGGGAAGVGLNGGGDQSPEGEFAGDGGPGEASSISGSELYYAGGGGGQNNGNNSAANRGDGGIGGGGTGATAIQGGSPTSATAGATNRGGGGGGGNGNAGLGGSGVVIIRYPI